MRGTILVLVDGHRSPRLEANAKRVLFAPGEDFGADGSPSPELVVWVRQHAVTLSVAGPGGDRVVRKLSEHGLLAQRVDAGEPAAPVDGMRVVDNILELVGDTPLVRLDRLFPDSRALVLGKLEAANPGGSTKDRVAVSLVDAAERDGRLKPGGRIVEPTSGNTGVGLAIVAARRGSGARSPFPTRSPPRRSPCSAPTAPKSSSARRTSKPTTPAPTTRSPDRSHRPTPPPSTPTSTRTRRTRQRTSREPDRRSGRRPEGRSRTSSPEREPAAPSAVSVAI